MEQPPEVVLNIMGVRREQWEQMTPEQRLTVAQTAADAISDQLEELATFIKENLIEPLTEALIEVGDSIVDVAATVEQEIKSGRADLNQATPAEQAQTQSFLHAARKYDEARGLNKMKR